MWRKYQIFIPLLSLFLNRVDLTDLYPLNYQVNLLKIIDGDTVLVKLSRQIFKVRISKIDSPELGQPYWNKRGDAGLDSLKCFKKLVSRKKMLSLKIFGQDMFGRILGDLDSLSFSLIKEGCTTLYQYARFSSRHEKWEYIRALDKSKQLRRGLWSKGGYLRPSLWRKKKLRKIFGKK